MFRAAFIAINAIRNGKFIRLDGVKYIALPSPNARAPCCVPAKQWTISGRLAIESVLVTSNNTYAKINGRVFATYAVKFAVDDVVSAAYIAAIAPTIFALGSGAFPFVFCGCMGCYGYKLAVHENYSESVANAQHTAISIAMGCGK